MIGVNEAAAAKPAETMDEFHSRMIGYYGRVLRIRATTETFDYARAIYSTPPLHSDYRGIDKIGRLQGIMLNSTRRGLREERVQHSKLRSSSVSLNLQGSDPLITDYLAEVEVQVLQEDTGQWLVVHRGAEFFDPSHTGKANS